MRFHEKKTPISIEPMNILPFFVRESFQMIREFDAHRTIGLPGFSRPLHYPWMIPLRNNQIDELIQSYYDHPENFPAITAIAISYIEQYENTPAGIERYLKEKKERIRRWNWLSICGIILCIVIIGLIYF
jgi:hypothetical protein